MRISGHWAAFNDGKVRPLILAQLVAADGERIPERFLIDTGADQTVLSATALHEANLATRPREDDTALMGVGGAVDSVIVSGAIEFIREDGVAISVRGNFAAFLDAEFSNLSILGRDVLDNFDVIVSRRRNEVLLVAGRHHYSIEVES